jgi:putative RecB family exonuclease
MTTTTPEVPAQQAAGGPVDLPVSVLGSLSPSRASDFMSCPLKYRFRVIDRLPEQPSPAATRGTLVHAVLERLFELPPLERTPDAAAALIEPAWQQALADAPELAVLVEDGEAGLARWVAAARDLLNGYFTLEDPRRLQPAARELFVEHVLESGLKLRGYIDRLDRAPTGELRVVDYKTGRSPGPQFERSALFQMKFYALVLWRSTGVVARELRLYYLGDRQSLAYHPDEAELRSFERTLHALWAAIDRARSSGDWRAKPSKLCDWCDHQALCPAFGGTPPPLPEREPVALEEPSVPVCEPQG